MRTEKKRICCIVNGGEYYIAYLHTITLIMIKRKYFLQVNKNLEKVKYGNTLIYLVIHF